MRLLNTITLRLEYFQNLATTPEYAILSHTWGDDEILFEDLDPAKNPDEGKLATTKSSLSKVLGAAGEALLHGYPYIWIDSCCIDKSSSAELSEAINSMFRWYANARECYAYLSDFTIGDEASLPFDRSRWFTRGWTLQELIAPDSAIFFDSRWKRVGTRAELALQLAAITKIPVDILNRHTMDLRNLVALRTQLDSFSVSARMLWAGDRQTTRVEDRAYSLMGIFDVNMPLLYGEGSKAFQRLQETILMQTNDQSILAFTPSRYQRNTLARTPGQFVHGLETYQHVPTKPMTIASGDVEADVLLCPVDVGPGLASQSPYSFSEHYLAILHCNVDGNVLERIAILLKAVDVDAKAFSRVTDQQRHFNIPVCFKLQLQDDGKTWAVPATTSYSWRHPSFGFDKLRVPILEFEKTRIVIGPPDTVHPSPAGRQVTRFPLQISLRGQYSGQFYIVGKYGKPLETPNGFLRVGATGRDSRLMFPASTSERDTWGSVRSGYLNLFSGGLLDEDSGKEVRNEAEGFIIIWGYKFPMSNVTLDPREDQMICYVYPTRGFKGEWELATSDFRSKAGRVSSCWNEKLKRRATAEIWTKTALDRTCAFMTVDVSGGSDEAEAPVG